jgi:hypothetical protein
MRQLEAAQELGIAPCTLKAACKRLGIGRWPWRNLKAGEAAGGDELSGPVASNRHEGTQLLKTRVTADMWHRANTDHNGLLEEALDRSPKSH